jgi:hypothetical protein
MTTTEKCPKSNIPRAYCTCVECQKPAPPPAPRLLDETHLVVDVETLGVRPGSAVVAIGARLFSRDAIGKGFEIYINPTDAVNYGEADRETLDWWAKQDPTVHQKVMGGVLDTRTALSQFFKFIELHKPRYLWANSPAFDCVQLQEVVRKVNLVQQTFAWPISFRDERCSRTIRWLAKDLGVDYQACWDEMKKHDPLDDATGDARAIRLTLLELERIKRFAWDAANPDHKSAPASASKLAALGGPGL